MKINKPPIGDLRLLIVLIIGTLCCVGASIYLRTKTNTNMYNFLTWDIFLAWIPLIISTSIRYLLNKKLKKLKLILILLMCIGWLFFLPNSAYLFTELLHSFRYFDPYGEPKFWVEINFWYSLTITFTAAIIGLLLSIYTIYQMQGLLKRLLNRFGSWMVVGIALFLSSLGVYIGRFNRWNSWDVLYKPHIIFKDIITDIYQERSILVEFVALIFIIQVFGYVIFSIVSSRSNN